MKASDACEIIGQINQDIFQELYDKWGINKAMGQAAMTPLPKYRILAKPRSAGKTQWLKQATLDSAYNSVSEAMREVFGDWMNWMNAYPYFPPRKAYAPVSCGHEGLKAVGI